MSKDWHSGHFCCWNCDESLTGQRYVLRDEHPYCIKCYESVFANTCEECNTIIGIDSKVRKVDEAFKIALINLSCLLFTKQDLSYKDKHWHEACFLCQMCRISLVDKQFGSKTDKIYCGNCYDSQFASRCDGCAEVFRAGEFFSTNFVNFQSPENQIFYLRCLVSRQNRSKNHFLHVHAATKWIILHNFSISLMAGSASKAMRLF